MDILPAIDLLGGKCVRLIQGRYDRIVNYERDPVEMATDFRRAGAEWIHVVDLDGARDGTVANFDALRSIVEATGAKVEFGGGIRDEQSIAAALEVGAQRVIIGTRALEDWDWFKNVVNRPAYHGKIALGLDARLGKLAVRGWTEETEKTAVEVAETVSDWPLSAIVYTDIGRDGLLLGPNIKAIRALASVSGVPVVASGGVTDIDDIARLDEIDLMGVVIGRAIYEGTLTLSDAIARAQQPAKQERR